MNEKDQKALQDMKNAVRAYVRERGLTPPYWEKSGVYYTRRGMRFYFRNVMVPAHVMSGLIKEMYRLFKAEYEVSYSDVLGERRDEDEFTLILTRL